MEVIPYRGRANVSVSIRSTSTFNKLVGENMKKLTVLVALALLAVAGTGYAVTCAYDNVPGATLLVPYFRVGGTVDSSGYISPASGTDTKVSFVNVSDPGIIAHVTVWNKYSKAVLDFNVPMTGKDVVSFSMKDILNGHLNVNAPQYDTVHYKQDVCGINLTTGVYNATPFIGWGSNSFLRFGHPQAPGAGPVVPTAVDPSVSISQYGNPPGSLTADAFAPFRASVLTSLSDSGDITAMQTSSGQYILDTNNPACGVGSASLSNLTGDFSGYLTIDVVNFCTNFFPDQAEFYTVDAIATSGWSQYGYTPNVLMGDVFYVDQTANTGNISGDPAVALEFDTRLDWVTPTAPPDTFFGRFVANLSAAVCEESGGGGCLTPGPAPFFFGGDGREPLGERYGFRYLSDTDNGLRSWIEVWRGDQVATPTGVNYNLCGWLKGTTLIDPGEFGYGFYDDNHQITALTYDNDESLFVPTTPGGPSGGPPPSIPVNYIFLESQRISLLANTDINPGYNQTTGSFLGGWIDMTLKAPTYTGIYNQGWVGVQHTGPGTLLNVGYSATNLNENFYCSPAIAYGPGVQP
jgi:hypothetical protein